MTRVHAWLTTTKPGMGRPWFVIRCSTVVVVLILTSCSDRGTTASSPVTTDQAVPESGDSTRVPSGAMPGMIPPELVSRLDDPSEELCQRFEDLVHVGDRLNSSDYNGLAAFRSDFAQMSELLDEISDELSTGSTGSDGLVDVAAKVTARVSRAAARIASAPDLSSAYGAFADLSRDVAPVFLRIMRIQAGSC